jgi:hypothetical protein
VLFSVFRALGLSAAVRPVLGDEAWDEHAEYRMEKWFDEERDEVEGQVEVEGEKSRVGERFERIRMCEVRWRREEDPSPVSFF